MMKKRMENRWRKDACLVLCGLLLWLLRDAQNVRASAARALALCAGTVIPALFPFLVISSLLIALGFGEWLEPHFAGLMTPLFRLPGQARHHVRRQVKQLRHSAEDAALLISPIPFHILHLCCNSMTYQS